ncbi:carbohydrate ABC transporter permease [Bifidobacterium callimiconis]|uniref:Sugar ABC transporter permease n=1 Tax=Bifidobacterium callimiconis TaxID=2306973 RepID=A0A430FGC7_9BIFI|nr:carbohydrate ABC transporter permease [Bifidobacterium callimiconis]RSX51896.1 sugar ABC transporter permease [Bifidobacterium callimiconis]
MPTNTATVSPNEDVIPVAERHGMDPVLKRRIEAVVKHAILLIVGFAMIFPLLWMVSSSLKDDADIFRNISLIPTDWDWANYKEGWNAQSYPFGKYLLNSLIITIGAIIGNMISCSMAAYGFTRLKWRGQGIAFGYMLMTLMMPIYVMIIPQYIMWSKLGFLNTFVPLILPKFLATEPFFVFLMVQFFRGIPRSLDEAAKVDGAGPFRIYWQILMPNALPSLATCGIFSFIWTWNDFFSQLLYLTKPQNLTVAVALRNFADATSGTSWGPLFAMSTLSLVPVFIVFLFGQRYLIEGSVTSGLK